MTEVEIKKKPPKVEIKEKPKPDSNFDLKKTLTRIAKATPPGAVFTAGMTLGKLAKEYLGKEKGGLAEATAKLKAKGFKDGGMVVKEKIVSIDKSPNSGLITVKGFGASRRT